MKSVTTADYKSEIGALIAFFPYQLSEFWGRELFSVFVEGYCEVICGEAFISSGAVFRSDFFEDVLRFLLFDLLDFRGGRIRSMDGLFQINNFDFGKRPKPL